ncbi:hypothetical protein ACOME3_002218 [Neoechinorhynchus agilis]
MIVRTFCTSMSETRTRIHRPIRPRPAVTTTQTTQQIPVIPNVVVTRVLNRREIPVIAAADRREDDVRWEDQEDGGVFSDGDQDSAFEGDLRQLCSMELLEHR